MTSAPVRDPMADHLLTAQNAALLLIDYQPSQLAGVRSMENWPSGSACRNRRSTRCSTTSRASVISRANPTKEMGVSGFFGSQGEAPPSWQRPRRSSKTSRPPCLRIWARDGTSRCGKPWRASPTPSSTSSSDVALTNFRRRGS